MFNVNWRKIEPYCRKYVVMGSSALISFIVLYMFAGDRQRRAEMPVSPAWDYVDTPFLIRYYYETGKFDYESTESFMTEEECNNALVEQVDIESSFLPICTQKMPRDLAYTGDLRGYRGGLYTVDVLQELTISVKKSNLIFVTSSFTDSKFQKKCYKLSSDYGISLRALFEEIDTDKFVYFISPGSDLLQITPRLSHVWSSDHITDIELAMNKKKLEYAMLSSNFRSTMNHMLEGRNKEHYVLTIKLQEEKLNQIELTEEYLSLVTPQEN